MLHFVVHCTPEYHEKLIPGKKEIPCEIDYVLYARFPQCVYTQFTVNVKYKLVDILLMNIVSSTTRLTNRFML